MKASRLHSIGTFTTDELTKPVPTGKELLIRVSACGICGSDIPRIYELGTSNKKYPLTLGHEFSGVVVAVGEEADASLVGTRGAVFPIIPCRRCGSCEQGKYAMCSDYDYLGSRRDGGFADYCLLPSEWHLVKSANEQTSFSALAMVEPATVAQHAVRTGGVTAGSHVVIFGAGPIGIMAARWCRIFGASSVLLVDVVDEKVAFAAARGADACNGMTTDVAAEIRKRSGGLPADVVIEGTGTGAALRQCIDCVKAAGTIVLMGNPHKDTTIPLASHSAILRKELTLKGIWNSNYSSTPINEWNYTVEMLDAGRLVVEDLITHTTDLDGLPELCRQIYSREISICKAMCCPRSK